MTEEQLARQQEEVRRLSEELDEINYRFEKQMEAMGITPDELDEIDESDIPPAMREQLAEAMREIEDKAKREGAARATQAQPVKASGACRGRRGAMRI